MKKAIVIFVYILMSQFAFSQLYVSPSSYVFVNNQFMYVTQEVELNGASNIYLRNNAQLLQGTSGAGVNRGVGDLSIFQEGTVNNFQYNYWCSPVGAPLAAAGNNTFGITRLFNPTGLITSTAATILPVNNYNGTSNPLAIAPYWIWRFITSNTYAQWAYVGSASTINAGEGFTMKGTSGTNATVADSNDGVQNNSDSAQRYDFRGKPNDGTIGVAVSNGNFTLVGNPYPSTIDLNLYLNDPANAAVINGAAYFWEQSVVNSHILNQYQGGYGLYTVAGGYLPADIWTYNADGTYNTDTGANGTVYQRRFTPVGQGFMVMGRANGTVRMRNSFRNFVREGAANFSQFARTSNEVSSSVYDPNSEFFPEIPNLAGIDYTQVRKGYAPQLRINAVVNNVGIVHTALGFGNQFTDGFDYSADARATSDSAPYGFYFVLNNEPHEYAMSLTSFDSNKRLPVGLRSNEQATFKIKVADVLYGFDANQMVYMHDKSTDIYYDIKNGTFEMTLLPGDNRTRFEISFTNTTLSNPDEVANMFAVVQDNEQGMLTIYNTFLKDIKSVEMFDISGKLIINKKNIGTVENYQIATSNLSDGVYVVKTLTADNVDVTKKVAVFKK